MIQIPFCTIKFNIKYTSNLIYNVHGLYILHLTFKLMILDHVLTKFEF